MEPNVWSKVTICCLDNNHLWTTSVLIELHIRHVSLGVEFTSYSNAHIEANTENIGTGLMIKHYRVLISGYRKALFALPT